MKVFGHPVHMMLIHFPAALLPMDFLLSFFAYYTGDSSLLAGAFYCLVTSVAIGALAIVTGIIDALRIEKDGKQAIATALIHGFINTIVLVFFGIFAYKAWQQYPEITLPAVSTIIIKAVLVVLLFAGNYFGGKLILEYFIGVKK
jgi:uncharacterized membrane protein